MIISCVAHCKPSQLQQTDDLWILSLLSLKDTIDEVTHFHLINNIIHDTSKSYKCGH